MRGKEASCVESLKQAVVAAKVMGKVLRQMIDKP